ncbi:MAG: hypothetical protein H6563_11175 [Lewinellaceae bacterium]|nr:hypothetical protein [Lewinellaceae bacterium]
MKLVNLQWCWPLAFCAAATLFSCQSPPETTAVDPLVKPPIPGAEPGFTEWTFLAEEGSSEVQPSGTRICIPPYAFVDTDGNPVYGPVTVRYREMHDGLSIFLAGIPMDYQNGQFTTAGSFEIRASQEGQALGLAEGNSISVLMASFEEGEDYDFFFLDENEARAWEELGTNRPLINSEKVALSKKIERMQPSLAFPLNRKYMAFNYNAILDMYYKNDLSKVQDNIVKRDMEAYGLGWVETGVHEWIQFKGETYNAALMVWKNLDGKAFPEWTKDRWGDITQEKGNDYVYTMKDKEKGLEFSVRLRAIMPLSTLFAFPPEKWQNEYDAIMAKIEEETQRMQMMASVMRSFEVSELGIYNWDKLMKESNRVLVDADFKWPVEVNEDLANIEVVLITGDNKGVVKYPPYSWDALALVPDPNARFFAVLPGNRIAIYPPADFKTIDFEALRKNVDPTPFLFGMKATSKGVKTEAEVREFLQI